MEACNATTKEWKMTETMGDRIRMQRARLRMSQAELGKKIGLTVNSVSALESGQVDPKVSKLKAIAEVFDVSTDYLLGLSEQMRRAA